MMDFANKRLGKYRYVLCVGRGEGGGISVHVLWCEHVAWNGKSLVFVHRLRLSLIVMMNQSPP